MVLREFSMEYFLVFVLLCAFTLALKFGVYDGLRELWYDHNYVNHQLRKPIPFTHGLPKSFKKSKDEYFKRKYTIAYWVMSFFASGILLVDYFCYDGRL